MAAKTSKTQGKMRILVGRVLPTHSSTESGKAEPRAEHCTLVRKAVYTCAFIVLQDIRVSKPHVPLIGLFFSSFKAFRPVSA